MMIKKLRTKRGDTISEALIAVLIVALSLSMLAMSVSISAKILNETREETNNFYDELSHAEVAGKSEEKPSVRQFKTGDEEENPEEPSEEGDEEEPIKTVTKGEITIGSKKIEVDIYGGDGELQSYRKGGASE